MNRFSREVARCNNNVPMKRRDVDRIDKKTCLFEQAITLSDDFSGDRRVLNTQMHVVPSD